MSTLRVKNWARYQHYKDRCPPWIKLATDTFQNYEFSRLQDASKLLAICIWTIAARSKDGSVPHDFAWLKSQGCLGPSVKPEHLKELINQGFVEVCSEVLADCKQTACSEGEGETERETEAEGEVCAEIADVSAPAVLVFPTSGGVKSWNLTEKHLADLRSDFPNLDALAECRAALAWVKANPSKKKTASGMPAFLARWMTKSQNRGGQRAGPVNGAKTAGNIELLQGYEMQKGNTG